MRIETDHKLDYDDVLIKPKRSTLSSRKNVKLTRLFKFRNTDLTWERCSNCCFKHGYYWNFRNEFGIRK